MITQLGGGSVAEPSASFSAPDVTRPAGGGDPLSASLNAIKSSHLEGGEVGGGWGGVGAEVAAQVDGFLEKLAHIGQEGGGQGEQPEQGGGGLAGSENELVMLEERLRMQMEASVRSRVAQEEEEMKDRLRKEKEEIAQEHARLLKEAAAVIEAKARIAQDSAEQQLRIAEQQSKLAEEREREAMEREEAARRREKELTERLEKEREEREREREEKEKELTERLRLHVEREKARVAGEGAGGGAEGRAGGGAGA